MNNQNFLHQELLNNPEQLANFYSVEISELLCECPQEMDIIAVERLLAEYRDLIMRK